MTRINFEKTHRFHVAIQIDKVSDDGKEHIINPKCVHCKVSDDGKEKIIEPNVFTVRCQTAKKLK